MVRKEGNQVHRMLGKTCVSAVAHPRLVQSVVPLQLQQGLSPNFRIDVPISHLVAL